MVVPRFACAARMYGFRVGVRQKCHAGHNQMLEDGDVWCAMEEMPPTPNG